MTDYSELVERAKAAGHDERLADGQLYLDLAAAIEAQKRELDEARAELTSAHGLGAAFMAERDEARAELAKVNREKYPFVHLRFDVSGAEVESALRAKLVELGWTPPADLPPPAAAAPEPEPFHAPHITADGQIVRTVRDVFFAAPEPKPDFWALATEHGDEVAAPEAGPNYGPQPPGYRAGGQLQGPEHCKCSVPEHSPYSTDHCYYCGRAILQQSPALAPLGEVRCHECGTLFLDNREVCPFCGAYAPSPAQPEGE